MATVRISESTIKEIAATWVRSSAIELLIDPAGGELARFVFSSPYETDKGRVFDSALVRYSPSRTVADVKCGLKDNLAKEAAMLKMMFKK